MYISVQAGATSRQAELRTPSASLKYVGVSQN